MTFDINLKDVVLKFDDIIILTDEQRKYITDSSHTKTFGEWQDEKTAGIKIPLLKEQKETVIRQKNSLTASKDERAIEKDGTIIFSKHAIDRIALRVDKFKKGDPPTRDSLLLIIILVIESQIVDNECEWKGFTNLSYTLVHNHLKEKFKITVSFEAINGQKIKVITVSNEHIEELSVALMENPDVLRKLMEFKKRLI